VNSVAQSAIYRINEIPFTKRREAESQGLVKVTWVEGVVLCNTCYMYLVENPLRRGIKRVKVRDEKEASIRIELTKAIEAIGKILYEREHVENMMKCETCSKQRSST